MFFLYDANLKLLKTIPSDVYQGSDGADDIYFLVPINPNAAINVAFLLPTGKTLTSRPATKQGEAVGLETPDGISYAMWSITLTAQETAYAGNVTLQITVISGAMRMTSQKGVFPVLTGVPPVLPEAPQADAYNDIRAAIAALQTAVYNTKAIGISTYSYNESKKNATIKSYVTSATRVVVPDYVIKGDEYYIVTGIDPNVKPPTSVTEYEFGSNITSIGAGAFVETNITRLEFPKNLTSIGDSAFTDATTTEFIFNGAVPTIGGFAFSGVNATAYVPAVYYDDYVTAFEPYSGIVVKKKSETLADVIETADEAKAIALKAQSTADNKLDKSAIVQGMGNATDKVMSQKTVTDELDTKLTIKTGVHGYDQVYGITANGSQELFNVSDKVTTGAIVRRKNNGQIVALEATTNDGVVNLGQLTTKLLDYLLKSGGIISGNLSIQGDLEVRGTTKTTEEETLNVKDSIVVTNSSGADLSSTLAGFVIRLNATDCYGIIYDASSESVKLGLGKITDGKFTFNEGEGNAVAVRADGSLMTNGHLVKWDATALKFVDAGKSVDDFVEKVTDPSESYRVYGIQPNGEQIVYKTSQRIPEAAHIVQLTDDGTSRTNDPIDSLDTVNKRYFEATLTNKQDTITDQTSLGVKALTVYQGLNAYGGLSVTGADSYFNHDVTFFGNATFNNEAKFDSPNGASFVIGDGSSRRQALLGTTAPRYATGNMSIYLPNRDGTLALLDDIPASPTGNFMPDTPSGPYAMLVASGGIGNTPTWKDIRDGTIQANFLVYDKSNGQSYNAHTTGAIFEAYNTGSGTLKKFTLIAPTGDVEATVNIPNKSGTLATLDDIPTGGGGVTIYSQQYTSVGKADGIFFDSSFDNADVHFITGTNTLVMPLPDTKTLFGNQSIYGEGNIDFYRHNVTIRIGATGSENYIHTTIPSSKNTPIETIADLKTMLNLGASETYPANGIFNDGADHSIQYLQAVGANLTFNYMTGAMTSQTLTSGVVVDVVKPI